MKLRIRGNSIRLRLTKSEVEKLIKDFAVEEATDFGNGISFVYALSLDAQTTDVSASFEKTRLEIMIPQPIAENWATSENVSISAMQNTLKLLIEKDFNCLQPRDPEEDQDTFPHPKSSQNC